MFIHPNTVNTDSVVLSKYTNGALMSEARIYELNAYESHHNVVIMSHKLGTYVCVSSYVSIQNWEFNFCTNLEFCIKHLRIKHCFHLMCLIEQNGLFLGNCCKKYVIKIKVAAIREETVAFFTS